MRAWQVHGLGDPRDVLRLDHIPDPEPGPGQVLVRVRGAAANFPDVLMCQGAYQVRPPLPFTPGIELCGEVVSLGAGVTGFTAGDRVIGSPALPSGAYAELALMNADTAFPAPDGLDDAEAAAFFITYQTGWFGLHRRARPEKRCSSRPRRVASAAAPFSSARRPEPGSSASSAASVRPRWPAASARTW
jgi:NADPH:quinone reductase